MKKLFITITLTAFILVPAGAWAANTVVTGGLYSNVVNITTMATDYDAGTYRQLQSIQFNPGSDGSDVLIVRDGSATGAIIFKSTDAINASIEYYEGIDLQPYIDYSECTFSTGHLIKIIYLEI